jgi:hypothetical protein
MHLVQRWAEAAIDSLAMRLAWRLPRRLVYFAGLRILSEATQSPLRSHVGRELAQGEIRLLHALDAWTRRRSIA